MKKNSSDKPLKSKSNSKKLLTPGDQNFGRLMREEKFTTIYIGNLVYNKDEFAIKKLFSKYGKVTYVRLVRDSKTKKSKGFGFVQMPNAEDAARAIKKLNLSQLDGRTAKVSIAIENDTIIRTSNGNPIVGNTPKVAEKNKNEEEKTTPRKKRVKGLDLLFKNTRK